MEREQVGKARAVSLERLARSLETVGFPHALARVYAALTLAPGEGLSSSELVETLGISKASVSNATQFLVGTELAEKYRVPGSRESHYRIRKGQWGPMLAKKFAVFGSVTIAANEALEYTDSEQARERLEEMRDAYSFFEQQFDTMIAAWKERGL